MNHPFRIIPLLLKARRPSRIIDMPALKETFWLRKGYEALTFFGFILMHSAEEARSMNENRQMAALKNHEMIHLRQAQACGDSWLSFYWKYLVFWVKAQKARSRLKNAGYLLNPFEMEAYANMYNLHYLDRFTDGKATGWKRYASMSLDERIQTLTARRPI